MLCLIPGFPKRFVWVGDVDVEEEGFVGLLCVVDSGGG
jgi:hypothetical protein